MGSVGDRQYYRFELVGSGLRSPVICQTLQPGLEGVKDYAQDCIDKHNERELEVTHAKFRNGIRP